MRLFHRKLRAANNRTRGFTLVQLLVVIGIIALLAGVLLPMLVRARRQAQSTIMKLNLQTISTALENYHADFRDYPRNVYFDFDSTSDLSHPSTANPTVTYRTDGTLAMALVGPGPRGLVTSNSGTFTSTGYANGDPDGNDGVGFRTRLAPVGTLQLSAPAAAGATIISVTVPGIPYTLPDFTVVALGTSLGADSGVVVSAVASGGTITLARPLIYAYPTNATVALLVPAGKSHDPYIPADKFNIVYQQTPFEKLQIPALRAEPMLVDQWGEPILYLPSNNTYANHTNPVVNSLAVAPILGIGPTAAWPNFPQGQPIFWMGSLVSLDQTANQLTPFTAGQIFCLLYRMGVRHDAIPATGTPPWSAGSTSNSTNIGETFNVTGGYILGSAGPDGIFQDISPTDNVNTVMSHSDDVYNFDQ